jgi:cytochrome c551/c552
MRKLIVLFALTSTFFIYSCGGGEQKPPISKDESATSQSSGASKENPAYDAERGKGKFTDVTIAGKLDPAMVIAGEKVYNIKCSGCHKLTNEKLVGPGWKDVTTRHKPEWIMNFVTNTDEMIDKDPKAQAMLELCMVRMPNQNISDEAARGVYEYMRKNDGVK